MLVAVEVPWLTLIHAKTSLPESVFSSRTFCTLIYSSSPYLLAYGLTCVGILDTYGLYPLLGTRVYFLLFILLAAIFNLIINLIHPFTPLNREKPSPTDFNTKN